MSDTSNLPDFTGTERFSIVRRIGAGGMGVVYEAFDRDRQMRVALKTLQLMEPNRLHKFKQEFRNFTDIVHPNIAVLHELLSDGETWFFTMELVDGVDFLEYIFEGFDEQILNNISVSDATSIHQEIPSEDPVPAAETPSPSRRVNVLASPEQQQRLRQALLSLAEGVNALHEAGRIHRDLKPSNVMVSRDDRVVVLDFGLSTTQRAAVGQHFQDDKISGTISYMSPEQMSVDSELTPASDWYSVGTMMYQALTGRLPYSGTVGAVVRAKRTVDPAPPKMVADGVPDDLEELCMRLLRRDPEERPSGPEIIESLGGTGRRQISVRSEDGPLVGRNEQLQQLSGALAAARSRRTVVAFVHGKSGAGKTFLVNRFLADVVEMKDVDVFLGRCFEAETVPYKSLDSLIDSLARYLASSPISEEIVPRDVHALTRLFPVLRQVTEFDQAPMTVPEIPNQRELRRRAIGALRELLIGLAERRTVILCIDDLQWGDTDSANVLLELLRQPGAPRILLLGVYRSEYAKTSEPLSMLLRAEHEGEDSSRIDLPISALSPEDSRELATMLLGSIGNREERAEAIARESGGVPYFIHELARYTLEQPALTVDADWHVSLTDVLERRFDTLPEESRQVLEVISVVGRPLRRGDAFRATALPPEGRAAFSQLRASSMIRSTGSSDDDTVEVYHDRIRETLVDRLSPERTRAHYTSLATTLEASGGYDPETVAICFRGSGDLTKAGDYYERGAIEATEALAFARAANLYQQSLELRPDLPIEKKSDLLEKRAEALANAGRTAEAARVFEHAIEGADGERAVELQRLSAYHYCSSGRLREGRTAMEALLKTQGLALPQSPAATIARLLWNRLRLWHIFRKWQRNPEVQQSREGAASAEELRRIDVTWSASAGMSMMDIVLGAAFQAHNLVLALRAGEPYRIARAMAWEAAHTSNGGSDTWPRTLELIDAASRLARRVDIPQATAMVTLARGIAEFTMGRFRDAVPLLEEAEEIFRDRCTGVTWEIDTAYTFKLWGLIYQGKFEEMAAKTSVLISEAEEHGDLYASTNLASFMVPHAHLAADQPDRAREAVYSSQSRWAQEGFHLQNLTGIMSSTLIDLYEGDGVSAWSTISGNWKTIKRAQILRIQILRIFLTHFRGRSALEAALQVPDGGSRLVALARKDAERLAREGAPWARPMAMSLESAIATHRGDRDGAIELMKKAMDDFGQGGLLSYHAAAMRRLGQLTEDASMVETADDELRALGVTDPVKMTRMHLPGMKLT